MAFSGSGSGTETDPYKITNWNELDEIKSELDAWYELQNDLDENTDGYDDNASDTANDGRGWIPIGSVEEPFSGTFDGAGYKIADIHIADDSVSSDTGPRGLFAVIDTDGHVFDLTIKDPDMSVENDNCGALAGENSGTIEGCKVKGDGTINNGIGYRYTGALVGYNYGIINESESEAEITVDFEGEYGGGLVGINGEDATIERCSASGDLTNDNLEGAGGLVGQNDRGDIIDSRAEGYVQGFNDEVGGLVGYNKGTIDDSYAIGDGSSDDGDFGALVGKNDYDSYSHAYGLIRDSVALEREGVPLIATDDGQTEGRVAFAPEGDMKNIDLYTEDDFEDYADLNEAWDIATAEDWDGETWNIQEGNDYPRLGEPEELSEPSEPPIPIPIHRLRKRRRSKVREIYY